MKNAEIWMKIWITFVFFLVKKTHSDGTGYSKIWTVFYIKKQVGETMRAVRFFDAS